MASGMTKARRGGAVWMSVVVAACLGLAPGGAQATTPESGSSPTTTLNVNPSDNLPDTVSASVSGAGFDTSSPVNMDECTADLATCSASLGAVMTNVNGTFPATVNVNVTFPDAANTTTVNCRAVSCVLHARSANTGKNAQHHLSFGSGPTAATGAATNVAATTATLAGDVNPKSGSTTVHAEYSTSPTLDAAISTPATTVGSGNAPIPFSADVSGLAPATTYYFRVVAAWGNGKTTAGGILSFNTAPAAAGGPAGGPGGGLVPDIVAPVFLSAKLTNTTFSVPRNGLKETPVAARARKGTKFLYALSEPARVVFSVQVKRRKRHHPTRYVKVGAFAQAGLAGANAKPFSGRIGKTRLGAGSYRVTLTATDAAGQRLEASAARVQGRPRVGPGGPAGPP